ncbi:MAG: hypothetical protein K9H61_02920 [Bacteroidia bacterium]|nr:hypothetical protein [Bacteroidia bacterium]MCF8445924.1 hypothetical protein [Bacteroidia bacterium]
MLKFKEIASKNYINFRGWATNKKFLIIESDDWGTIRMPSKKVYETLLEKNIEVDRFSFDKQDALESSEDLTCLFDVLESVNDTKGNPAVLTAYHVMANPNFESIEANGKNSYVHETIIDTYKRNLHTENTFEWIKKGMKKGLYIPQFHGREHIQVKRWMEAINSNSTKEKIAFENKAIIWTGSPNDSNPYKKDYFKGFDCETEQEAKEVEVIHRDGLRLFKEIFGMESITFQAQGSVWGDHILPMLHEQGVRLIGGQQTYPSIGGYKTANKYWGSKNSFGQIHWRRNCMFEPARNQNFDWVGKCLAEIEIAFRWSKPAVISSHRENFIGSIFEENRTQSLQKLESLLKKVLQKWPDVQFISSARLADIMLKS